MISRVYKALPDGAKNLLKLIVGRFVRDYNIPFLNKLLRFKSYLDTPLVFRKNPEKKYFVQYYRTKENPVVEPLDFELNKVEILSGQKKRQSSFIVEDNIIFPISFQGEGIIRIIKQDNTTKVLKNFKKKRYYYLNPPLHSKVQIECKKSFILGSPIKKTLLYKKKPKIVLCLFVDGLSNYFEDKEHSLKDYMPETYRFFSEGIIFNNCHSNAEWSLPSVATISTGKYPHNHKIVHPRRIEEIEPEGSILSEYFQQDNYLTFNIGSNWRKHPNYGYIKGFDRTIYKSDMDISEVIQEFTEQTLSFPNRNQFGWLDIFNLHNINHMVNVPHLNSQIYYDIDSHDYSDNKKIKSVYSSKSISKTKQYHAELIRTDNHLKNVYSFIKNYFKDDFLVILCSDHGQACLAEDNHPLSDNRIRVPLMIRGVNVPNYGESEEYIENVDILPSILTILGIDYDNNIDGRLPRTLGGKSERSFVFSESIYPNKKYTAVIRTKNHKVTFTSENKIDDNMKLRIGNNNSIELKVNHSSNINNQELINKTSKIINDKIMKLNK